MPFQSIPVLMAPNSTVVVKPKPTESTIIESNPPTTRMNQSSTLRWDKAQAGQKGMPARVRGGQISRLRVPCDHRFGTARLFAASCGERAVSVGPVYHRANTDKMTRHLADTSAAVAPTGAARWFTMMMVGTGPRTWSFRRMSRPCISRHTALS